MADMREDVESWDVSVVRKWPYFKLGATPYAPVIPPVEVNIVVKFLTEESALEFETQVRGLLQP